MGSSFDFIRRRWRTIEIGEEIFELIKEMKDDEIDLRPSIDQALGRLIKYCDEKKYSNSIDIIPFLKEKKVFVQLTFNDEDISPLKKEIHNPFLARTRTNDFFIIQSNN